ncbi:MAG: hypothetical protein IPL71_20570 [Anaerolineales bacterium]|uniref:hypothetical protein n=1 Tax=Candidatus Villigracilis proximus TaxID=3140683 RepID=UPI00313649C7|nr:hypothetical protein [Anaerolineales bacterium]
MIEILRDPIWQGISGIVAIVSLTLYILVERGKLPKLGSYFSSIKSFFVVMFLLSLYILLFGASYLVIDAVTKEYGLVFGNAVSEIIYGLGVLLAFIFVVIIFPGDFKLPIVYMKTISLFILLELVVRIVFVVFLNGKTPQDEIFGFWRGVIFGGLFMYIAISWMNFNYSKNYLK